VHQTKSRCPALDRLPAIPAPQGIHTPLRRSRAIVQQAGRRDLIVCACIRSRKGSFTGIYNHLSIDWEPQRWQYLEVRVDPSLCGSDQDQDQDKPTSLYTSKRPEDLEEMSWEGSA
jgi:hypothetical protein